MPIHILYHTWIMQIRQLKPTELFKVERMLR